MELIVATCQECGVEETSLLNFVISDGLMLLATRCVGWIWMWMHGGGDVYPSGHSVEPIADR